MQNCMSQPHGTEARQPQSTVKQHLCRLSAQASTTLSIPKLTAWDLLIRLTASSTHRCEREVSLSAWANCWRSFTASTIRLRSQQGSRFQHPVGAGRTSRNARFPPPPPAMPAPVLAEPPSPEACPFQRLFVLVLNITYHACRDLHVCLPSSEFFVA